MLATQLYAIHLCRLAERIAPRFGFHTALTGGCLYKDGERKDIDILFYKHSDEKTLSNKEGLLAALKDELMFEIGKDYGRVVKAKQTGVVVDLLFPGFEGQYREEEKFEDLL